MKAHFILTDNQILLYKGDQMYNAYEKDIAVVNLYFGDSTAFGKHLTHHTLANTSLQLIEWSNSSL